MSQKRLVLCGIYLVFSFICLAVLRFPGQEFSQGLTRSLNRMAPGISVDLGPARLQFPPGIKFDSPDIFLSNGIVLPFEQIRLGFSPIDLFRGEKGVVFSGELAGGQIKGRLKSGRENRLNSLEFTFDEISPPPVSYDIPGTKTDISFQLEGQFSYPSPLETGKARAGILLSNVVLEIDNRFFSNMGMDHVLFDSIELDLIPFDKGDKETRIRVLSCSAKGKALTLNLKGDINPGKMFSRAAEDWILNLEGYILPDPALVPKFAGVPTMARLIRADNKNGIPIRVTGSVKNPNLSL